MNSINDNNNPLFDDLIDFYLRNDLTENVPHLNSNNENDEEQLDLFCSFLDKECFHIDEWEEPIMFNPRLASQINFDMIDNIKIYWQW